MTKTRIRVDYSRCGDGVGADPRDCGLCLRACGPAVFLLHQTLGAVEPDPFDPRAWRVTPLWPSLCTGCGECVSVCPQGAIEVRAGGRAHAGAVRSRPAGEVPGSPGADPGDGRRTRG